MKRQIQGFSLIEVLIAIAILGVASLALLSFFSSANFYSSTGKSTQSVDGGDRQCVDACEKKEQADDIV